MVPKSVDIASSSPRAACARDRIKPALEHIRRGLVVSCEVSLSLVCWPHDGRIVNPLHGAGELSDYSRRTGLSVGSGSLSAEPWRWIRPGVQECSGHIPEKVDFDEIWTGEYEYFDDGQEAWLYDCVWPEIILALTTE